MLKKIALLMMLILPMGVFAQNLKFGHINAMEIVSAMPEYTKAQSELQALNKQLGQDLQRSQEEFSKKYQEFMQQKDSLPAVIAERRQKELEDRYGKLICYGIASIFFFHVVVNVGMIMGVMPVTGLPLLFMSYGGSSFVFGFHLRTLQRDLWHRFLGCQSHYCSLLVSSHHPFVHHMPKQSWK